MIAQFNPLGPRQFGDSLLRFFLLGQRLKQQGEANKLLKQQHEVAEEETNILLDIETKRAVEQQQTQPADIPMAIGPGGPITTIPGTTTGEFATPQQRDLMQSQLPSAADATKPMRGSPTMALEARTARLSIAEEQRQDARFIAEEQRLEKAMEKNVRLFIRGMNLGNKNLEDSLVASTTGGLISGMPSTMIAALLAEHVPETELDAMNKTLVRLRIRGQEITNEKLIIELAALRADKALQGELRPILSRYAPQFGDPRGLERFNVQVNRLLQAELDPSLRNGMSPVARLAIERPVWLEAPEIYSNVIEALQAGATLEDIIGANRVRITRLANDRLAKREGRATESDFRKEEQALIQSVRHIFMREFYNTNGFRSVTPSVPYTSEFTPAGPSALGTLPQALGAASRGELPLAGPAATAQGTLKAIIDMIKAIRELQSKNREAPPGISFHPQPVPAPVQ